MGLVGDGACRNCLLHVSCQLDQCGILFGVDCLSVGVEPLKQCVSNADFADSPGFAGTTSLPLPTVLVNPAHPDDDVLVIV